MVGRYNEKCWQRVVITVETVRALRYAFKKSPDRLLSVEVDGKERGTGNVEKYLTFKNVPFSLARFTEKKKQQIYNCAEHLKITVKICFLYK